jgi:hypothetical protein
MSDQILLTAESVVPARILSLPIHQRVTATMPSGTITPEGERQIKQMILDVFNQVDRLLQWHHEDASIEWVWMTKRGTLPKRIANFMHKRGVNASQDLLSTIGQMGKMSAELGNGATYYFEFDQSIAWHHGQFADEGACTIHDRSDVAIPQMKDLGFYAIRFYEYPKCPVLTLPHDCYHGGIARAWMHHVDANPGCWLLMNGYGLSTLSIAHVLSMHFGWTYKKVLVVSNAQEEGFYVNNDGRCYVLGNVEDVKNFPEEYDLEFDTSYSPKEMLECACCNERYPSDSDEWHTVRHNSDRPHELLICYVCYENDTFICVECEDDFLGDCERIADSGEYYCVRCASSVLQECQKCNALIRGEDAVSYKEGQYCETCCEKIKEADTERTETK